MTRNDVASFVSALIWVYSIILFVYILVNWFLSMGMRPGYHRWFDAVLTFLRDVSEPYLRIFRGFIPQFGAIDISPIVALVVLRVVGSIIVSLING